VRRRSRGLFWRSLAEIGLRRPALLEDFLWMVALEEYFLAYMGDVDRQVQARFALLPPAPVTSSGLAGRPPSRPASPAVAAAP